LDCSVLGSRHNELTLKKLARKSVKEGKEYGVALCKHRGKVELQDFKVGNSTGINASKCEKGSRLGSFHTHMNETPIPSEQDIKSFFRLRDRVACISGEVRGKNGIVCFKNKFEGRIMKMSLDAPVCLF